MVAEAGSAGGDLFPRFSQAEFDRRHRAVRQAMAQDDLAALLIYGGPGAPEVSYLSNYLPASPCWLLFPRQGEATLLLHFYNHIPCTKAQTIIDDVRCYGPSPTETLAKHLLEQGLAHNKIGLVSLNTIAYNQYVGLQRLLLEVQFAEFGRQFNSIRWVRSDEELVYLRRSGYLTDLTCEALEQQLRPGLSEYDIRSIVVNAFTGHDQRGDHRGHRWHRGARVHHLRQRLSWGARQVPRAGHPVGMASAGAMDAQGKYGACHSAQPYHARRKGRAAAGGGRGSQARGRGAAAQLSVQVSSVRTVGPLSKTYLGSRSSRMRSASLSSRSRSGDDSSRAWASARSCKRFERRRAASEAARSFSCRRSARRMTRRCTSSSSISSAPLIASASAGSSVNCTGVPSGPIQFSEWLNRPVQAKPAASSWARGS